MGKKKLRVQSGEWRVIGVSLSSFEKLINDKVVVVSKYFLGVVFGTMTLF